MSTIIFDTETVLPDILGSMNWYKPGPQACLVIHMNKVRPVGSPLYRYTTSLFLHDLYSFPREKRKVECFKLLKKLAKENPDRMKDTCKLLYRSGYLRSIVRRFQRAESFI